MTRRRIVRVVLALAATVCLAAAYLALRPDPDFTPIRQKYAKVHVGMTLDEVKAVLGEPTRQQTPFPPDSPKAGTGIYDWAFGPGQFIQVDFYRPDPSGAVVVWDARCNPQTRWEQFRARAEGEWGQWSNGHVRRPW
jgi:hypothetical protein